MKEQFIHINREGNKYYYSDKKLTTLHREDGPALEYLRGNKEWWVNGELHREDGPAVERIDGYKAWWQNGKLHREDGPAVEHIGGIVGYKAWWQNGMRHRDDGPAYEDINGYKVWYLNDELISQEEHARRTQKEIVLTLDEIADKLGIDVSKLKIKK